MPPIIPLYFFCENIRKWKIHWSYEIDQKRFFDQNSALQTACGTSIARVTGGVPHELVTPLLMPGSTGLRRSALFCARKLYNIPHWGGQNQASSVPFSMHYTICVLVWVSFWSGLLGSTGVVRKFLCTPYVCGRPAEVQPRPDARVSVLSSHDGICGGRRSPLLRSDLSSALDAMQRQTHTPVLIEWRPTIEIWRSASGVGRCTLDPKALRVPIPPTTREYTN